MIALEIFNSIADKRDGTLSLEGWELPATGYFVGGVVEPLVFDSAAEANTSDALRSIAAFCDSLDGGYVGWWTDQETGKVYVDGSSWHHLRSTAMRFAVERGEIAFWAVAEGVEVRTVRRDAA